MLNPSTRTRGEIEGGKTPEREQQEKLGQRVGEDKGHTRRETNECAEVTRQDIRRIDEKGSGRVCGKLIGPEPVACTAKTDGTQVIRFIGRRSQRASEVGPIRGAGHGNKIGKGDEQSEEASNRRGTGILRAKAPTERGSRTPRWVRARGGRSASSASMTGSPGERFPFPWSIARTRSQHQMNDRST